MSTEDNPAPESFDWQHWVNRWERMQERYLVGRAARFEIMTRLVRETQASVTRVVNLGCGPGSLMIQMLTSFPHAQVCGIDFDPTILVLARARLDQYGDRAQLILADLRDASWPQSIPAPVDAVVSATALHWLVPDQLARVYHQVAQILRPGGILLNADHVGSPSPEIQQAWVRHREELRAREDTSSGDDWDGFWKAYAEALNVDVQEAHQRIVGGWEGGVEDGLPLAWHLDRLRESGFWAVDCFWRCDCDAIYGGIRCKPSPLREEKVT